MVQVCGSMPYDDSDVKKMIKYQTERKVGFARSKKISDEVKDLIHCILEAQVERRYTVSQITQHPWMLQSAVVVPPPPAASRKQTPDAGTKLTLVAGEAGRVGATPAPAAVVNDTLSQNNNSNVDEIWSRCYAHLLNNVHSRCSATGVIPSNSRLKAAAQYALQSAIDRVRLHKLADQIWSKRRPQVQMENRRPWR